MNATKLVALVCFAMLAWAAPAYAQVTVDTNALQAECARVAQLPVSQHAARLAETAQEQRADFDRMGGGRIKESSQDVIQDSPPNGGASISVGAALAWHKVYNYYVVAGVENVIGVSYAPDAHGNPLQVTASEYRRLVDQAFPPTSANSVSREQLTAPLEQILARDVPWSAAFISSLVAHEFDDPAVAARSAGHWGYIEPAVLAVARNDTKYAYVGCNPSWVTPRVGDIICNHRENGLTSFEQVVANAETNSGRTNGQRRGYASHCDMVVETHYEATRPSVLAIGGNVSDSVSPTTYYLDAHNCLIPRNDGNGNPVPLIAVLMLRAPD